MAAAKGGHTDTLRALLDAGAPPNARTRGGLTAVMLACRHDRVRPARKAPLLLSAPTRQLYHDQLH